MRSTRQYDWVGMVIHWELCKRLKSDQVDKWYMRKPESVLENETHKILLDREIQTDHSILARRPGLVLIMRKKRICHLVDLDVAANHCVKMKESENIAKYSDLARGQTIVEHKGDGNTK